MLLDIREFEHGIKIAERIERKFLETYFGSYDSIIDFGKYLIIHGQREAAKELENWVTECNLNNSGVDECYITGPAFKYQAA